MVLHSPIRSLNPATEEVIAIFEPASSHHIEHTLTETHEAYRRWRQTPFSERAELMQRVAARLRQNMSRLASLITLEMGKPIGEAEAEVNKCAWTCEFYAEHAEQFLADQFYQSHARESYVTFIPLGPILAIMPWNYPIWQVIRHAAPALMAGNTVVLKPALNVPQCALATEEVFRSCGFPEGVFRTLLLSNDTTMRLLEDPRIAAVTLTGSDRAGSQVGAVAGGVVKKAVLELGGSDPFIVLEDADLTAAVETGVRGRYQNAGQSCVAAKRFIVTDAVFDAFQERFIEAVTHLQVGDPTDQSTQIGPLARVDLRDTLERQVQDSIAQGATLLVGGERWTDRGYFYAPTVLSNIGPTMPAFREEVFGPVAPLIKVRNAAEAIHVANDSSYGLGSSVWTTNLDRARRLARELEAGQVFINGRVASDPRLPFGGTKRSGYGRELSEYGMREFVNIQTVWIGPAKN